MNLKHLAGAALLLAPLSVFADSVTSNLAVSAIIVPSCTVSTSQNLSFGQYSPAADKTGNGTIKVTCSDTIPYTVSLNEGLHSGKARNMAAVGGTPDSPKLGYELFQDSQMNQAWGSIQGQTKTGTGTGSDQEMTVYGKIRAGQTSRPGTYSDTVTVTVSYDGPQVN